MKSHNHTQKLPAMPALILSGILFSSSCTTIQKTVDLEHRVFIRVPGADINEKNPYDSDSGWHFRHVVSGPATKDPATQWYLAYHDDHRDRLARTGFSPPWASVQKLAPEIADAAHKVLGAYPQIIEPGAIYKETAAEKAAVRMAARSPDRRHVPTVHVGAMPSKVWPQGSKNRDGQIDPVWHLDKNHSQLADARDAVRAIPGNPGKTIRIGILDTGFDAAHSATPYHVEDDVEGDAIQALRPENDQCQQACRAGLTKPGETNPKLCSHGTGALGILAGRKVHLKDSSGRYASGTYELGAAPDAQIVAVRIAHTPASLSTANLAYGIDYASRVKKCDVISLSHGGSPSMMWTDAVNAAYDRGTAIFAATGDYFPVPFVPGWLNRVGIIVPSSTVFPASYRRVMGVAGVTETGKSYALTDWPRFFNALLPSEIGGSFMRGSYGADGVLRSKFNALQSRERGNTDIVQTRLFNELRANPISAYSPAIPWPKAGASTTVDLDGAGTSAATPQAAAAAAHWLAYHRKEIEANGGWNNWRKAEASYLAMALTAQRPNPDGKKPADQSPSVFLGCGTLKANDMLKVTYKQALSIKGTTLSAPYDGRNRDGENQTRKKTGCPRDFYDGDRSFFKAAISSDRDNAKKAEDIKNRADIRHTPKPMAGLSTPREIALHNLYFNMLLIQQYQLGNNPLRSEFQNSPHTGLSKFFKVPNEVQLDHDAFYLATGRKFKSQAQP